MSNLWLENCSWCSSWHIDKRDIGSHHSQIFRKYLEKSQYLLFRTFNLTYNERWPDWPEQSHPQIRKQRISWWIRIYLQNSTKPDVDSRITQETNPEMVARLPLHISISWHFHNILTSPPYSPLGALPSSFHVLQYKNNIYGPGQPRPRHHWLKYVKFIRQMTDKIDWNNDPFRPNSPDSAIWM
jgi:hypothetical protein